jgi:type VI secretion system protein ImpA
LGSIEENLKAPISAEQPCGEDLEDSPLLAGFDAYRVFGQLMPLGEDTDWREIRDKALEGLGLSKDLRLLAHLAAATLRTQGLAAFCSVLDVAGKWFSEYPEALYPRVDEDAILRKNALNSFADRMAIIDAVRRKPFVSNTQLGAFGLRDYEVATGRIPAPEGESELPSEAHFNAALTAADTVELGALSQSLAEGVAALRSIDSAMRDAHGSDEAPDFDALLASLAEIERILQAELGSRAGADAPLADGDEAAGESGNPVVAVGSIRSREDAVRALDAVASFFRKNEPSSPVPIIVERAKRLISMDFLELLADLAPDGLDQAKRIGGIQDE